jgi:hypothetical protein
MTDPALWTAIAGVIGAVVALVRVWQHKNGPQHKP